MSASEKADLDRARRWLKRKRLTTVEATIWVESRDNDGSLGFLPETSNLREPDSLAAEFAAVRDEAQREAFERTREACASKCREYAAMLTAGGQHLVAIVAGQSASRIDALTFAQVLGATEQGGGDG